MSTDSTPRYDAIFEKIERIWTSYLQALEESLDILDKELATAEKDSQVCTIEWCTSTEELIADLVHVIYNLHVPKWISKESADRLKEQKKRIHNLYARFITITTPDAIFA
jgi:hypothetical protein